MAVTLKYNYTPTTPTETPDFTLDGINFSDYACAIDEPGHVQLSDMTAPLSNPHRLSIKSQTVADIYKGTGVEVGLRHPSRKGISVCSQATALWSLEDSEDLTYDVALPVSAHIVLKLPTNEYISEDDILALLQDAISNLFDDTTGDSRLMRILRGALRPNA